VQACYQVMTESQTKGHWTKGHRTYGHAVKIPPDKRELQ